MKKSSRGKRALRTDSSFPNCKVFGTYDGHKQIKLPYDVSFPELTVTGGLVRGNILVSIDLEAPDGQAFFLINKGLEFVSNLDIKYENLLGRRIHAESRGRTLPHIITLLPEAE